MLIRIKWRLWFVVASVLEGEVQKHDFYTPMSTNRLPRANTSTFRIIFKFYYHNDKIQGFFCVSNRGESREVIIFCIKILTQGNVHG